MDGLKVLFWMNNGFDVHSTSEHLLKSVIEQLAESGNRIHVIQMNQGGTLSELPAKLVSLGVTSDSIPYKAPSKGNFFARYLGAIRYYWSCREALKKHHDSDAVFLQSTNVACASALLARKYNRNANITLNVQDIFPYNAGLSGSIRIDGFIFKVMAALQRQGYKTVDHIITISEDMKDTLIEDGTPAGKIEVIYNWSYQDEPYKKENLDMTVPQKLFKPNYFNVVYAGNVGIMQNVDIIVKTAALMKNQKKVWFHIIGNGQYKEKLQKSAEELGISYISFWPMQPPEAAPSIYSAADVNIIPLVKNVYRTALPSKTATCLACGQPIIFAIGKDSKFGKLVAKETGCSVIDSDDANEMASTITEIMQMRKTGDTIPFYLQTCSRTRNSRHYADIITKKG